NPQTGASVPPLPPPVPPGGPVASHVRPVRVPAPLLPPRLLRLAGGRNAPPANQVAGQAAAPIPLPPGAAECLPQVPSHPTHRRAPSAPEVRLQFGAHAGAGDRSRRPPACRDLVVQ